MTMFTLAAMALKMSQLPRLIIFLSKHTLRFLWFDLHCECFIFVNQQHGDEKVQMNDVVALAYFDSIQWL